MGSLPQLRRLRLLYLFRFRLRVTVVRSGSSDVSLRRESHAYRTLSGYASHRFSEVQLVVARAGSVAPDHSNDSFYTSRWFHSVMHNINTLKKHSVRAIMFGGTFNHRCEAYYNR